MSTSWVKQTQSTGDKPVSEREADEFAEKTSSKASSTASSSGKHLCLELDIVGFARTQRVHPGLVVGQLHFRGLGKPTQSFGTC